MIFARVAPILDENGAFIDDAALRKVLGTFRTLCAGKPVVEDVMTLPDEGTPSFASGRHMFRPMRDYNRKVVNDPEFPRGLRASSAHVRPRQHRLSAAPTEDRRAVDISGLDLEGTMTNRCGNRDDRTERSLRRALVLAEAGPDVVRLEQGGWVESDDHAHPHTGGGGPAGTPTSTPAATPTIIPSPVTAARS